MPEKPLAVKFVFNPGAGKPEDSPRQLVEILTEMQNQNIVPEVYLLNESQSTEDLIDRARKDGTRLIVVSGGDGTIDQVARSMLGHHLTLGIIPTGTRNNLALNLGIPSEIPAAVKLLRDGRAQKIDVGMAEADGVKHPFLEVVTLGLLSDLYFVTDDIQHGDLSKVGEFISTLVTSTPFVARIEFDRRRKVEATAYMVVIANMQYLGANVQIDPNVSHRDGELDIFVFTELSKINLISYALRSMAGDVQDPSVQHYRAKEIFIDPSSPVTYIADGFQLTDGKLSVKIKPRALSVIVGDETTQAKE
jgi:YegS/Rv2252/BmrU family lipid kinase